MSAFSCQCLSSNQNRWNTPLFFIKMLYLSDLNLKIFYNSVFKDKTKFFIENSVDFSAASTYAGSSKGVRKIFIFEF